VPLLKLQICGVEIDMVLCSKKCFAAELKNSIDVSNKKSFNSIQGYECSLILEKVALNLPIPK